MTNQVVIKIKTCLIVFLKYYYFDICFKTLINISNICDYISFLASQRRHFKKSWCECTTCTINAFVGKFSLIDIRNSIFDTIR